MVHFPASLGVRSESLFSKTGDQNLGPTWVHWHPNTLYLDPTSRSHRPKRINNLAHPLLFRDQGVGGSNPLSPTILSLTFSIIYAALAAFVFAAFFGTFGTTEGSSKPKPHCSAHFLRNATSSLILS